MPIILAIVLIIGSAITGGIVTYQRLYIPPENQTITRPAPTLTEIISPSPPSTILQREAQNIPTVQGAQTLPKTSSLNNDADPLITCNSKTGKIVVRKSVCISYTDCPNGYGGYVFESQEACKSRWQRIGSQLKNLTDEYVKALKEQGELNRLKLQLESQQFDDELNNRLKQQSEETNQFIKDLENKNAGEYQRILQEQNEYFKNFIKSAPTPTPLQTSTGEIIDPPDAPYGIGNSMSNP